jgi:predicted CoA-binding protein
VVNDFVNSYGKEASKMMQLASVETLQRIFAENRSIAVVGLSPKTNRPSNQVALYLQQAGYRIIPVNPGQAEILGEPCYPDLQSIPGPVDVVDIFRRSEQVEPVVRDAIAIGAKVVWMQQGIVNVEAAAIGEQAGLTVIMDRCLKVDHIQFAKKN